MQRGLPESVGYEGSSVISSQPSSVWRSRNKGQRNSVLAEKVADSLNNIGAALQASYATNDTQINEARIKAQTETEKARKIEASTAAIKNLLEIQDILGDEDKLKLKRKASALIDQI